MARDVAMVLLMNGKFTSKLILFFWHMFLYYFAQLIDGLIVICYTLFCFIFYKALSMAVMDFRWSIIKVAREIIIYL